MLTPADKIATHANDIIQIVVTRKCDIFTCSNCTQILPLRKDATEMTVECVEEALAALHDWPGVIAMFGGNPCTHSRFADLCDLWAKYVQNPAQRGLWTNNLMGKGSTAAATFFDGVSRFNFNVHTSEKAAAEIREFFPRSAIWGIKPSQHGAVLGYHADYGVPYSEWVKARERCDINQRWSAGVYGRETECDDCNQGMFMVGDCVTCKGIGKTQRPFAYFCEVAGSIDGVTQENNGIPATEGWWKRPIEDFYRQIDRCCDKHCVVPLRYKGSVDIEDNYDVSRSVVPLTTDRIGKVTITCHSEPQPKTHELTDYQELRK